MIKIYRYIYFILIFLLLEGCSEDVNISDDNNGIIYSEVPVEIFAECIDGLSTRGVANPKTSFSPGDYIHVEASFFDKNGNAINLNENSGNNEITKKYKAYVLQENGKWLTSGNDVMLWPVAAKKGFFRAYYVKTFNQTLVSGDNSKLLRLSEVDGQSDPLYAELEIEWGHKVNFRFSHMCTHITFTNLDPDIADYFWLINKNDGVEGHVFNNAFSLKVVNNELIHEFTVTENDTFNGLTYVQHKSNTLYEDETGIKKGSEVSFFLEPGDYSNVELRTINNYSYLAFQSDLTKNLLANVPYEIDIKKNKGITYIEEEEDWDDDDESNVWIVDPDTFLESVEGGYEYVVEDEKGDKHTILKPTSDGTLLCANVSFDNKTEYTKHEITPGKNFDGGNHYISNIKNGLFTTNKGSIKHLGLKDINCDNIELWYVSQDYNNNRFGVLCEINEGNIENIKLENVTVSYNLGTGSDDSGNAFDIGSLVGYSPGTISKIEYSGNIKIISEEQGDIKGMIHTGGFIGLCTGSVSELTPSEDNNNIEVITKFEGETLTVYAGGAIGYGSGNINDVSIPSVTVDSSGSSGMTGSTGGIAGRLRGSSNNNSLISSCTVSGIVKGMPVTSINKLNAYSYTGGITGYSYKYDIKNCRTLCEVWVDPNKNSDSDSNITYATGGGLGRLVAGEISYTISNNYIWPVTLTGPANYIGNFAGIVPEGDDYKWNKFTSNGNIAKQIISDYIGGTINDAPPQDD